MSKIALPLTALLVSAAFAGPANAQGGEAGSETILACVPGKQCLVRVCVPANPEFGLRKGLCLFRTVLDDRNLDPGPDKIPPPDPCRDTGEVRVWTDECAKTVLVAVPARP